MPKDPKQFPDFNDPNQDKYRSLLQRLKDAGTALTEPAQMPSQDEMLADPTLAKDTLSGQGLTNLLNAFIKVQPDEPGIYIGNNPITKEPMYMSPAPAAGITRSVKEYGPDAGKLLNRIATGIKATGPSEEAIRDLKQLQQFKKNPNQFQHIGAGVDKSVYTNLALPPEQRRYIKVPKRINTRVPLEVEQARFNDLAELGLDPNTKSYQTSGRGYQMQDHVTLIDKIDSEMNLSGKIPKEIKNFIPNDLRSANNLYDELEKEVKKLNDLYDNTGNYSQKDLLLDKINNVRRMQEALKENHPIRFKRAEMENNILGKTNLVPEDLHTENWGVDLKNNPKILDLGHFSERMPDTNITDEANLKALQKLRQNYKEIPSDPNISSRLSGPKYAKNKANLDELATDLSNHGINANTDELKKIGEKLGKNPGDIPLNELRKEIQLLKKEPQKFNTIKEQIKAIVKNPNMKVPEEISGLQEWEKIQWIDAMKNNPDVYMEKLKQLNPELVVPDNKSKIVVNDDAEILKWLGLDE